MTSESRGAGPELRALTGLRFAAAASVVAFHFVRFRFDSHGISRRLLSCGFTAVGLFFVLSGFILVYAYDRVSCFDGAQRRAFWRARFARVYPVYVLGMISGALVTFALGWARASDFTSLVGALRIGAVTGVLTGVSHRTMFLFNWAAWSLTSELLFYASFPFLIGPLRKLPTKKLIALGIFASLATLSVPAIYRHLDPDALGRPLRLGDELVVYGHYVKFFPLMHVHEFLWGMISGMAWMRFRSRTCGMPPVSQTGILAAAIVLASTTAVLCLDRYYLYLHSGLLAPIFAVIIVLLASRDNFLARILASQPFVFLGEASFVTYMIHVPLYLALDHLLQKRMTAGASCCLYLLTLVVLSIAVHLTWEKPLRQWITGSVKT